jgi:ABC-type polysaccharide transport system, permease component
MRGHSSKKGIQAMPESSDFKWQKTKRRIKKHWQLYLILFLPILYLIVFKYIPITGSQIAFRNYNFKDGIWGSAWAGLDHFEKFFKSPQFSRVLINTLGLSLYNIFASVLPPIVLAIALTYVGNRRWGKTVQMVTYMPYFISTVLVVGILTQMLSLNGPVNNLIASTGAEKIHFMGDAGLFKSMYVLSGIWQTTGYSAVIYIAALAAVDQEIHEAARVDGATIWRRIYHIDIPSITPTAIILLIMACGRVLLVGYEKVLLMQNDLNMATSDIITTYVYRIGLQSMQYSYSTAIGLFQSVVSLILLVMVNYIAKKTSDTSLW